MTYTWSYGRWSHGHINKIWAFGNQLGLTTDHRDAAASFSHFIFPNTPPLWVSWAYPLTQPSPYRPWACFLSHWVSYPPPCPHHISLHLPFLKIIFGKKKLPICQAAFLYTEPTCCPSGSGCHFESSFDSRNLWIVAAPKMMLTSRTVPCDLHIRRPHVKLAISCSGRRSLEKVSGSREEGVESSGSGSTPKVCRDTARREVGPKMWGSVEQEVKHGVPHRLGETQGWPPMSWERCCSMGQGFCQASQGLPHLLRPPRSA